MKLVTAIAILWFATAHVTSAACADRVKQAYEKAPVVFVGEMIQAKRLATPSDRWGQRMQLFSIRFRVIRPLKGIGQDAREITMQYQAIPGRRSLFEVFPRVPHLVFTYETPLVDLGDLEPYWRRVLPKETRKLLEPDPCTTGILGAYKENDLSDLRPPAKQP